MMVLEACNISGAIDVKTVKGNFEALCLINFPGENISQFSILDLPYIKVMKGGFNLPNKLGSTLLIKVSKTGTEMFNRQVMNQYLITDALKHKYEIKDPKLMVLDLQYEFLIQ